MAWARANTPGKPVWVTEFGWDAALPGERCNGTHCVSQYSQAVYAIRGLMILARKGVERAHWWVRVGRAGAAGRGMEGEVKREVEGV